MNSDGDFLPLDAGNDLRPPRELAHFARARVCVCVRAEAPLFLCGIHRGTLTTRDSIRFNID